MIKTKVYYNVEAVNSILSKIVHAKFPDTCDESCPYMHKGSSTCTLFYGYMNKMVNYDLYYSLDSCLEKNLVYMLASRVYHTSGCCARFCTYYTGEYCNLFNLPIIKGVCLQECKSLDIPSYI